jgi:outer membrane protein
MQRVVDYNESVQARVLAFQAARSQRRAEAGIFEPAFVTSGEYVDRKKPNTIEMERSLRSGGIFKERNENYSSGLEMQTPLGTRLRVGASGRQLINNIQRTELIDLDAEYETSVGITLEQPLLRGAGKNVTLAALRLAARNSEIAYQDYRRQLMQIVAEAELAYWQLYFAQEEVRLTSESLTLAQTLVQDTRTSLDAGRGSKLDVLEAEAGFALRRSRESLSRQKHAEARNRLASYFGGASRGTSTNYVAVEPPVLSPITVAADEGNRTALAMNPDILRAHAMVGQEAIRVGYSRNQRLPQLDLKSSFAATGLGFDWTSAWRDVEKRNFPAWTVGLELRVPIWGGVRGRNELQAAQLRLRQAESMEADTATQLFAGLNNAVQRVEASYTAARNYQAVVEFRSNLLSTRLQGRDVGRLDSRSVLEAEQELFGARLDQLQSEIEYQRALLDLQVVSGSLLQGRGLETSFADLERRTRDTLAKKTASSALQYQRANFSRWPAVPPEPFIGEPDPDYPWRTRLTVPIPWKRNKGS